MRRLRLAAALCMVAAGPLVLGGATNAPATRGQPLRADRGIKAYYLSRTERMVIDELNDARRHPKKYAEYVRAYRARHRGGNTFADINGGLCQTVEGLPAVDEAIEFLLKKAKPAPELTPSWGLSDAAEDHVKDQGPKGATGHDGSDGSAAKDRMSRYGAWQQVCGEIIAFGPEDARSMVVQWIVDDGVPGRGHRENIFNDAFRRAGVAVGPHAKFRTMCVVDFAGDYAERTGKPKS